MKTRSMKHASRTARLGIVLLGGALAAHAGSPAPVATLAVRVDAATTFQRIDGFGVNVTPAQWRGGALRPALDRLVDELGTSLVRLDCQGTADWLDPARRGADGKWPDDYLASVYRNRVFSDCWATFRYLAGKGVDVHLNVSGRVPKAWYGPDGRTLVDFDAYAEMAASLARWAREKEKLPFRLFAPFNETDLGPPEGPRIDDDDLPKATRAVVRAMDAAGLGDVKLVLVCDSHPAPIARARTLFGEPSLAGRVAAFSGHTYGDGDEGDRGADWYDGERPTAAYVKAIAASPHAGASVWMTEYGDLDQTGLVEWQFAWRSTRRLLKMLEDGFAAALAWDAFDNLHEHDGLWANYGLLATDRASFSYAPKKRFHAARQVYRFVRPGWRRVAASLPPRDPANAYANWQDRSRHLRLLAFVSPDRRDVTLVGMSRVEGDVALEVSLDGLAPEAASRPFSYRRTTRDEDARLVESLPAGGKARIVVPEGSIFTLTTLGEP